MVFFLHGVPLESNEFSRQTCVFVGFSFSFLPPLLGASKREPQGRRGACKKGQLKGAPLTKDKRHLISSQDMEE